MKLYLMRHGAAEDPQPGMTDRDRRLTPDGIAAVEAEARALAELEIDPQIILTSPYPRAAETARIVAKALRAADRVLEDARLACGAGLGDLQAILEDHPHYARVMVVGHNPDLPLMAARMAGGGDIHMRKGGVILIDCVVPEPDAGTIEWVLPPRILAAVRVK